MNAGFIAALLVMIIMTAFTFVILNFLAVHTGDKIRDNIVNQIKFYDVLVKKKESELQVLKDQLEHEKSKLGDKRASSSEENTALSNVFVTPEYLYLNQDFVKDYRSIKEKFEFSKQEIIKGLYDEYNNPQYQKERDILDDLSDKFSLANVYKMSAFSGTEQLEIIKDILTKEEKELLRDYILQNHSFNCLKFYQWLYVQRRIKDYRLYVNTAEKQESFDSLGNSVQTRYDSNLCEGIQIYVGNRLYDYGIRKCELLS